MLSLLSMIFRVMVHFCSSVLLPSQLFCAVPSRIVVYFVESLLSILMILRDSLSLI